MSKRLRTLILSLAAVLVLVGLLLVLLFVLPEKKEESSSTTSDTSITVIDKTKDASGAAVSQPVKKITVKTGDEQFVIAPNKDGQLAVETYSDLLVNTSEIDTLSQNMSQLTADKKITDNAENPADFGLDAPQAELTATYADDTEATVCVGNESPTKEGYYLQVKGDSKVYLLSSSAAESLLQKSTAYIGTAVITAPSVNSGSTSDTPVVQEMKLSGTVREAKPFSFRLRTDEDGQSLSVFNYVITSPTLAGFDSNKQSLVSATSLTASGVEKAHPTAEELKTYGLDNPYSVCEMSLAVQKNTADETSSSTSESSSTPEYYNVTKHTVKLGNKDADGNYYALVDSYNVVYRISASSVAWAESQYNDVVDKLMFVTNITEVASVSVQTDGKETTFSLQHNPNESDSDKKMTVTVDGKTYSTKEFRNLYQVFMSINRYGEADQIPSGNPDAVLTVIPSDTSGKKTVARFYKKDVNLYYCSIEGGDTYTVKTSDFERMQTEMSHYLNGETVNY